jgi:hypothetical protein
VTPGSFVAAYNTCIFCHRCIVESYSGNTLKTPFGGTFTNKRFFLTFGTTRLVDLQPYAPGAFTPRVIYWYSFLEADSTPGHMVPSVATEKIPSEPIK